MKLLTWLLLLPTILVVIAFAIANRGTVTVSLDPLPFAFDLPVFALALGFVFIGMCVGGAATFAKALRWHRAVRRLKRDVAHLEGELVAANAAPTRQPVAAATETLPAVSDAA